MNPEGNSDVRYSLIFVSGKYSQTYFLSDLGCHFLNYYSIFLNRFHFFRNEMVTLFLEQLKLRPTITSPNNLDKKYEKVDFLC